MCDGLSVMSTSKRPKRGEIPIAVNRVFGIQRRGADRPPEDMHDGQGLQSVVGDDRSFQQVCVGCFLHNGLSREDL